MIKYSEDYLAGWHDAREFYQRQNSVPPHPPEYNLDPEPEATVAATGAIGEEDNG